MYHRPIIASRASRAIAQFDAAHATDVQRTEIGRCAFDDAGHVDRPGALSPFAPANREAFARAYAAISRPWGAR